MLNVISFLPSRTSSWTKLNNEFWSDSQDVLAYFEARNGPFLCRFEGICAHHSWDLSLNEGLCRAGRQNREAKPAWEERAQIAHEKCLFCNLHCNSMSFTLINGIAYTTLRGTKSLRAPLALIRHDIVFEEASHFDCAFWGCFLCMPLNNFCERLLTSLRASSEACARYVGTINCGAV